MKTLAIGGLIIVVLGGLLTHYIKKTGEQAATIKQFEAREQAYINEITSMGELYEAYNVTKQEIRENRPAEIEKLQKADLSKVPVDKFVNDFNIGVERLLTDLQSRSRDFYKRQDKTDKTDPVRLSENP